MKYPLFASLGNDYPTHLEQRYERILSRIDELWDSPEIDDYFTDLLIDRRGGRQGFPREVLADIVRLRDLRASQRLGEPETPDEAAAQLRSMGYRLAAPDLFLAVARGSKEAVDLFVRANFNLDHKDEHGNTPMLYALKCGFTVVAQILLKAGAHVNARDPLGLTPLLVACGKSSPGYRGISEMLIRRGAYVDIRDLLGNTPFLLAVSGDQLDLAELLALRGADMSAVNRRGESAQALLAQLRGVSFSRRFFEDLCLRVQEAERSQSAARSR